MKRALTIASKATFLLAFSIASFGAFFIPTAAAYTSPGKPAGFVNDFAGIISDDMQPDIEAQLTDLRDTTGVEFSVVTVKSLGGDSVENFAHELFQEWGIGNKEKNNGLLLLVALDDRKARFEVGYGLEGVVTDLTSSRIQQDYMIPYFKNGDYTTGIQFAVDQAVTVIKAGGDEVSSEPPAVHHSLSDLPLENLIPFLGLMFLFFVQFIGYSLARTKSWWLGGALFGGIGLAVSIFFIASIIVRFVVTIVATLLGLLIDYKLSKSYNKDGTKKTFSQFLGSRSTSFLAGFLTGRGGRGGGFGSSGGGGFGGFSGGSSGGGGSSSSW